MAYWSFKQSEQDRYRDQVGRIYIYTNLHSQKVASGDEFVCLSKMKGQYAFSGHGAIEAVKRRKPRQSEQTSPGVKIIYTAVLCDYVEYSPPIDVRKRTHAGKQNRETLGISDFNKAGFSPSVASLARPMFERIVNFAYTTSVEIPSDDAWEHEVSDKWTSVKRRDRQEKFRQAVIRRQGHRCAICGTTLKEVLEVAHISSYARDSKNRANPANGIVMCAFCHKAFDKGIINLREDGEVTITSDVELDSVARAHISGLAKEKRLELMRGVDPELLRGRSARTADRG